ncbi:bifunctional ligase/repressor BirA [bacterium BMS3Abin05]|nr:bifunctional ligase/repressor BirA [bacterium BMS3Abin05]GBE27285.1 bifunctional ligase/repressor BirA [bacterium BMS3Bbin03]
MQLIGKDFILLKTIHSTNDYLLRLPESDKHEGLVVRAEEQTAGKGRLGRRWVSEKGKGLWFSILVRQWQPAAENYLLVFLSAVAVAKGVQKITGCNPEIKWPNDILLNRRKFSGILLEKRDNSGSNPFLVVGIGLNVYHSGQDFTDDYGKYATSIFLECGTYFDREMLFSLILEILDVYYQLYKQGKKSQILQEYISMGHFWGEEVRISQGKVTFTGRAVRLDEQGGLVIQQENQTKTVYAGDLILKEWFEHA